MSTWEILTGDVLEQLATLPDESVHCVVTSPPYWGLRDYGVDGMIGLEPTLDEHMRVIVRVFDEVRRVLRSDGTLWLNYGDAYSSGRSGQSNKENARGGGHSDAKAKVKFGRKGAAETAANRKRAAERGYDVGAWGASEGAAEGFDRCAVDTGLAAKQRLLMPARVALALQDAGWWVRSEIVWAKGVSFCESYAGSCMPSSVRDRPTDSHEMVYLLTKAPTYFYDADAVREEASPSTMQMNPRYAKVSKESPYVAPGVKAWRSMDVVPCTFCGAQGGEPCKKSKGGTQRQYHRAREKAATAPPGGVNKLKKTEYISGTRNLRTVWTINPRGYAEAHFATYPEALVEPCVKAGTSEHGCCAECGAPWRRVVEASGGMKGRSWHDHEGDAVKGNAKRTTHDGVAHGTAMSNTWKDYRRHTRGWEPTCDHDADVVPCTVLDPFSGSGTTGAVAVRLGRSYVGVELNPDYVALARKRIGRAAADAGVATGKVSADEDEAAAQLGLFGSP